MSTPPSSVESYLIDRWRRGTRVHPLWIALKGAILLGIPFTLTADLLLAAASDTRPDFGSSAVVCVPLAVLLALAARWVVGRVLRDTGRNHARDAEENSPASSNRNPDSP